MTTRQFTQLILNLVKVRDFFGVGTKLKESIFKNDRQIDSTITTIHDFCQQNGPERGQVQDWYPNEKMVLVCLNGRCCFSGCVGIVSY